MYRLFKVGKGRCVKQKFEIEKVKQVPSLGICSRPHVIILTSSLYNIIM